MRILSTCRLLVGSAIALSLGVLAARSALGQNRPIHSGACELCSLQSAPSSAAAPSQKSSAGSEKGKTATQAQSKAADRTTAVGTLKGHIQVQGSSSFHGPDLTHAVVYLASSPALDSPPASTEFATVAQKNKAFVPNFLAIPRGMRVEFPNWDNFDHNVFSRSAAAPAFDLARYPRGQAKSRVFDKAGVIQLFCNIHSQMHAIIVVTPNKFFACPDPTGSFQITNLPPGHYELIAWQERCGEQRKEIDVVANAVTDVSFVLKENRSSVFQNNPPPTNKPYGVERGLGVKHEPLGLPIVPDAHPAPTKTE